MIYIFGHYYVLILPSESFIMRVGYYDLAGDHYEAEKEVIS